MQPTAGDDYVKGGMAEDPTRLRTNLTRETVAKEKAAIQQEQSYVNEAVIQLASSIEKLRSRVQPIVSSTPKSDPEVPISDEYGSSEVYYGILNTKKSLWFFIDQVNEITRSLEV
jgi:hypothetical protein